MTRGDVWRIRVGGRGHQQRGPRYAVILQADELLALSAVIVAPTSRSAAAATFRPQVEVAGETTRVLIEQIRTLDIQRLDEWAGRLTAREQEDVDGALETVLGLV